MLSLEVTAAGLMSLIKGTATMLVSPTDPMGTTSFPGLSGVFPLGKKPLGTRLLWELNSILMLTFSFVLVEKHAHRSRE